MRLDVSNDWRYVDNLDSATLRVEGEDDVNLPNCVVSEPYTLRELDPAGAQVLRNGTVFLWPRSFSSEPPLGGIVIDNEGTYWTIYRMVRKQHIEYWEPFCLNLSIVTATANQATILTATYVKGNANEARPIWKGYWSGTTGGTSEDTVPARFQPSDEQARIEFGADTSREVYRVYFTPTKPTDLAGGEYRLVDQEGNRYRVLRYYQEERIDRLPVAIAMRITEGKEFWG